MKPASVILGLLLFCACGSPALVTSSWHRKNAPATTYNNIFVTAITRDLTEKQTIENDVQAALKEKGITVEKSIDVFPPKVGKNGIESQSVQMSQIAATGAQGLLIVYVARKEKETRFDALPVWEPSGAEYMIAHPEDFDGFIDQKFSYNGFYRDHMVYVVETRFYNTQTKQIVWGAESKTYDPNNIAALAKGYVDRIYPKMVKDGVPLVAANSR